VYRSKVVEIERPGVLSDALVYIAVQLADVLSRGVPGVLDVENVGSGPSSGSSRG
jgi:hypothetical protein